MLASSEKPASIYRVYCRLVHRSCAQSLLSGMVTLREAPVSRCSAAAVAFAEHMVS